jgi:hypothetical protein
MIIKIRKKLSPNDVGTTGTHQAGILVPKEPCVLKFFPTLDGSTLNPRANLTLHDKSDATRWKFNFIYYNNKKFGGTRNEYRLTCMTQYLRAINAKAGDEIIFSRDENFSYQLELVRSAISIDNSDEDVLVLSGGWKVVNTKK